MEFLSKSKIMAYRQCPKRLWLEVHRPELRAEDFGSKARFQVGNLVGKIAQDLYDSGGMGALVDPFSEGFEASYAKTQHLLKSKQPIFEGGFCAAGVRVFADILLPVQGETGSKWRMIEVKSSASIKSYHEDDVAVQAFVAQSAGLDLRGVSVAHIDSSWVYPGNGDYRGLLKEVDLTESISGLQKVVPEWIGSAKQIASAAQEPKVSTGRQCSTPHRCSFHGYCSSQELQAENPIGWLPGKLGKKLQVLVANNKIKEIRDVPDELLNERQRRVKHVTLSGVPYFDREGAAAALARYRLPAYFLDFETISSAVPIWKGTYPYQQIPFQFSVHRISSSGRIDNQSFLSLSGDDPSDELARALIESCGNTGPIFVYYAQFEMSRIRELAERYLSISQILLALNERVIDLLPIVREHYYHPSQQGNWSIKKVLPSLFPQLNYENLDGVSSGEMAMEAYREAIASETSPERKAEIKKQLLAYCERDTEAMVRLWSAFTGFAMN